MNQFLDNIYSLLIYLFFHKMFSLFVPNSIPIFLFSPSISYFHFFFPFPHFPFTIILFLLLFFSILFFTFLLYIRITDCILNFLYFFELICPRISGIKGCFYYFKSAAKVRFFNDYCIQ